MTHYWINYASNVQYPTWTSGIMGTLAATVGTDQDGYRHAYKDGYSTGTSNDARAPVMTLGHQ